ncbi:AAA family ATPase [Novosphingobium bradum]|uniref:AAA family ATPase n=1 Tax=Novosphingobium bradum TaxID=1737444 RepID=A0ABV7IQR6_9SPHN
MREAEFKEWLEANGANTDTGRNTRTHAVRTIEKQMGQLGSAHADLEAAWADDQFRQLRDRIKSIRQDAQAGGQDFRILMPSSENPLNRLSSWNSWLGQYGRFLAGKDPGTKDADRIRQYVLETYIEPARQEERPTTEVLVSDVNRALGLNQAWPNICQSLKGEQFLEMADVPPPEQIGADASSATRFRFDLVNAISLPALEKLRQRFLTACPDFVSFTQPGGFSAEEDTYKRALIARTAELVATADRAAPEQLGQALLDLLSGEGGLGSNLLGWRMADGLRAVRQRHPGAMEQIAGQLALAPDPVGDVDAFVRDAWPLLSEGQKSMPYGDSRTIPSMLAALVAPERTMGIRTEPTVTVAAELVGRRLLANAPLTAAELRAVNALAREIFAVMRDQWGWNPRDLWDVQGFIWVIGHNNEAILARFDKHPPFAEARKAWTSQETLTFCAVARAVNEAGLDWWHVGNKPWHLSFGRKSPDSGKAEGTLGWLKNTPARIAFNRRPKALDLAIDDGLPLAKSTGQRIGEVMQDRHADIAQWLPPSPARPGLWPDQFDIDPDQAPPDKDDPVTNPAPAYPTNLILYGPPGTGKTYATALEAVALCDGLTRDQAREKYPDQSDAGREALMERYRELQDPRDHRIEFVTFHQSYSYEDFVEGLRPTTKGTDEEGLAESAPGLRLTVHDGVFKVHSDRARRAGTQSAGEQRLDRSRAVFKIALGRRGEEEDRIAAGLRDGIIHLGWGGDIDWADERFDSFQAIYEEWRRLKDPQASGKDANIEMIYTFRASMQPGDYVVLSDGRDRFRAIGKIVSGYFYDHSAPYHPHRRRVDWVWVDPAGQERDIFYPNFFRRHSTYRLDQSLVDWDALDGLIYGAQTEARGPGRPHVLVIDEINRANISKVFGELITLIEPDKRLGQTNALTVTLPYSQKKFGVPANLHIVGTMNTADRSIALLDTALRRRFDFREIAPDPELLKTDVDGVNLRQVLATINRRVEYLVDREHRIGHAFFISCDTRAKIDAAMRNKVIPLLQEYFFEDWSRVHAVLGDGFIGQTVLQPPPGITGSPVPSWFVRKDFAENAYAALCGGAADPLVVSELDQPMPESDPA